VEEKIKGCNLSMIEGALKEKRFQPYLNSVFSGVDTRFTVKKHPIEFSTRKELECHVST
jgi:hypothetical protein